ncbi:hypothetical protein ACFRI7_26310 [Streptomyces sp. NPDC056716]|uniref:hypothetical protein n=1 Tax=unclassified Streptomyces TaxID=2593676 RepID=UPI0036CE05C4
MWARRRAVKQERLEREAAKAVETLGAGVRSTLASADEGHQALLELREGLARELADLEAMLGRRDGLPVDLVRSQLSSAADVFARLDDLSARYTAVRTQVVAVDRRDTTVLLPLLEELVEYVEGMAGTGEAAMGAVEGVERLRLRLERVRADLIPVRERVHAGFRAAGGELEATRGASGWYGRQAALAALGDRLTALDEGRVLPTAEHRTTDLYREFERELAELRDEIAQGRP